MSLLVDEQSSPSETMFSLEEGYKVSSCSRKRKGGKETLLTKLNNCGIERYRNDNSGVKEAIVPRQARLDVPGTFYHVIVRGTEKRGIVDDDKDRQNFVKRLGDLAEEMETSIYAWALSTNRAHLLLRSGPSGLPKFMRRFLTGDAVRGTACLRPIASLSFSPCFFLFLSS